MHGAAVGQFVPEEQVALLTVGTTAAQFVFEYDIRLKIYKWIINKWINKCD